MIKSLSLILAKDGTRLVFYYPYITRAQSTKTCLRQRIRFLVVVVDYCIHVPLSIYIEKNVNRTKLSLW